MLRSQLAPPTTSARSLPRSLLLGWTGRNVPFPLLYARHQICFCEFALVSDLVSRTGVDARTGSSDHRDAPFDGVRITSSSLSVASLPLHRGRLTLTRGG